jgi:hypothetical protein
MHSMLETMCCSDPAAALFVDYFFSFRWNLLIVYTKSKEKLRGRTSRPFKIPFCISIRHKEGKSSPYDLC